MSVYSYDYICPKCGRTDINLDEGIGLFCEYEINTFCCPKCKYVFSVDQNYDAKGEYYANCPKCGLCVEKWDGQCPDCGTGMNMEESRFYFLKCKTCGKSFQVNSKIYEGLDKVTCPECGGADIEQR